MSKSSLKPQLRFKNFTDSWEQCELKDMTEYISSSLSTKDSVVDGKYKLFDANGSIGYTNLNAQKKDYITIIKDGAGVGRIRLLPKNTAFIGTMGAFYVKNSDIKFLYSYLKLLDFSIYITGTTIPHIYYSDYKKHQIYTPVLKEQKKIGTLFSNLDNLITLHQRKYDMMKNIKKGLLEKMFPQNNETTPKIRFKGYTNAWEQRKLGEMTTYRNGKGHESSQSESGRYELINLNSISIDGGLKPSGKFINFTTDTLNINDLVIVLSDVGYGNLLGRVALIPENNRFVLNQRVALLKPNRTTVPKFLYTCINANQNYFKVNGAGSSQLNISKETVENFAPYIPKSKKEQEGIGSIFNSLDNLITLHQRKLDKLKNIKNAMLRKMFI